MEHGQTNHNLRKAFPAFQVDPSAQISMQEWILNNQDVIAEQLDGQGAMLLRGLNIDSPERLDEFVSLFPLKNFPYNQSLSNALRVNKTPRVFTANEAPAHIDIELHHEMAQTPLPPDWLFFSCALRAEAGGATPVCRSDLVYQDLLETRPYFIAQCEEQGLYYRQKFALHPDEGSAQGRSWPHLLELLNENSEPQSLDEDTLKKNQNPGRKTTPFSWLSSPMA